MGEPGDKRGDPRDMRPPRREPGYNFEPEEGRSRFNPPGEGGPMMRGGRGMRGARGSGRPMDRGDGMHHPPRRNEDGMPRKMGPPDKMGMEKGDRPDMRDRGHPRAYERENERKEPRMGPPNDQANPGRGEGASNHKIVQKSRGGRGGGPSNMNN